MSLKLTNGGWKGSRSGASTLSTAGWVTCGCGLRAGSQPPPWFTHRELGALVCSCSLLPISFLTHPAFPSGRLSIPPPPGWLPNVPAILTFSTDGGRGGESWGCGGEHVPGWGKGWRKVLLGVLPKAEQTSRGYEWAAVFRLPSPPLLFYNSNNQKVAMLRTRVENGKQYFQFKSRVLF